MSRPHHHDSAADLEARMHKLFADNRDIFEELIIRGWNISLNLPTHGFSGAFGYSPSGLGDGAGFVVTRSVTPGMIDRIIENKQAARQVVT